MLQRKGRLWVVSDNGEETSVTDRFRFEYHSPEGVYVMDTEPSLEAKPLYARTLRRAGSDEPLPPEEHTQVLARIIAMLQFSGDAFQVIN